MPPQEIKHRLNPILAIRSLKLENKDLVMHALDLYERLRIDFEDCLTIAHMQRQQMSDLYSYDRDFDQFDSVSRLEPK